MSSDPKLQTFMGTCKGQALGSPGPAQLSVLTFRVDIGGISSLKELSGSGRVTIPCGSPGPLVCAAGRAPGGQQWRPGWQPRGDTSLAWPPKPSVLLVS